MSRAMRRLQWKALRKRWPRGYKPTWADYLQWEANDLRAKLSRDKRT